MNRSIATRARILLTFALLGTVVLGPQAVAAPEKQDFTVAGEYVEGCSCMGVCPCEITGVKMGCLGVGAMKLSSGTYMGVDLTDAKIAYATQPGKWVRVYVDAKSPEQAKAAKAFATAVYTGFGKVEAAKNAKIAFSGADGKYTVSVNGGTTMKLTTEPVLGADKKTPVSHTNVSDTLNSTFFQGKTVSGSYKDGTRSMTLKGSNSFFNNQMQSSGKI